MDNEKALESCAMHLGETSREASQTPRIEVIVGEESRRRVRFLLQNTCKEISQSKKAQNQLEALRRLLPDAPLIFKAQKGRCGMEEITFFEGIFCLGNFRYTLQIQQTETGWEVTNSNRDSFEAILDYLEKVKAGDNWIQNFGSVAASKPIPERTHTADDYPSNGMPQHTYPLIELERQRKA